MIQSIQPTLNPFHQLPREIKHTIVDFMEYKSFLNFSATCQEHRTLALSDRKFTRKMLQNNLLNTCLDFKKWLTDKKQKEEFDFRINYCFDHETFESIAMKDVLFAYKLLKTTDKQREYELKIVMELNQLVPRQTDEAISIIKSFEKQLHNNWGWKDLILKLVETDVPRALRLSKEEFSTQDREKMVPDLVGKLALTHFEEAKAEAEALNNPVLRFQAFYKMTKVVAKQPDRRKQMVEAMARLFAQLTTFLMDHIMGCILQCCKLSMKIESRKEMSSEVFEKLLTQFEDPGFSQGFFYFIRFAKLASRGGGKVAEDRLDRILTVLRRSYNKSKYKETYFNTIDELLTIYAGINPLRAIEEAFKFRASELKDLEIVKIFKKIFRYDPQEALKLLDDERCQNDREKFLVVLAKEYASQALEKALSYTNQISSDYFRDKAYTKIIKVIAPLDPKKAIELDSNVEDVIYSVYWLRIIKSYAKSDFQGAVAYARAQEDHSFKVKLLLSIYDQICSLEPSQACKLFEEALNILNAIPGLEEKLYTLTGVVEEDYSVF